MTTTGKLRKSAGDAPVNGALNVGMGFILENREERV